MRLAFQILLFIFIAPLCAIFGAAGGCFASAFASGVLPKSGDVLMIAGIGGGFLAGIVIAVLIVRSIKVGA